MYTIRKRLEIAGAHYLKLDYASKCERLHGHNWIIYVELKSDKLNSNGMVMDFKKIKELIADPLDHQYLNQVFDSMGHPFNPTAENIAKWIADTLTGEFGGINVTCTRVEVEESPNNTAIYEI